MIECIPQKWFWQVLPIDTLSNGSYDGHFSVDEPESTVPLAKHRQVLVRTVFHIRPVFKNVRVSFVVEETRYSMTVCLIQFAHDFYLLRYFSYGCVFLPVIIRVCFLFDYHLLVRSSVSWRLVDECGSLR